MTVITKQPDDSRLLRKWMLEFLECDGLGVLLESLEKLGARGFSSVADTFSQLQCVSCLRAVMNSQVGLEYIVQHREYTRQLANILMSHNNSVKLQVFELLCALCIYSSQGHSLALDSLNYFKQMNHGRRYRFDLVIHELQAADTAAYQTTLLAFINCVILGAPDVQQRNRIRTELYGVGLERVLSTLRFTEDDALQIQLKVFDDNQAKDEELQEPLSVCSLFDVLYKKVVDTPQVLSLQSLLLALSQIDPADPDSDRVWEVLQEVISDTQITKKVVKNGSVKTREFGTQTTSNRWVSTKRRASCTIGVQVDAVKIAPALSLPLINDQSTDSPDLPHLSTPSINSTGDLSSTKTTTVEICKNCLRKFVREESQNQPMLTINTNSVNGTSQNHYENIPNSETNSSTIRNHRLSFTKIKKSPSPQSATNLNNIAITIEEPLIKNIVPTQVSPPARRPSNEANGIISRTSSDESFPRHTQVLPPNSSQEATLPQPIEAQVIPPPPPLPEIPLPSPLQISSIPPPPPPPPSLPFTSLNSPIPPPPPQPLPQTPGDLCSPLLPSQTNCATPPPPPLPLNSLPPPPPPMPLSSLPPTPPPMPFSSLPPPPPPPPLPFNFPPPLPAFTQSLSSTPDSDISQGSFTPPPAPPMVSSDSSSSGANTPVTEPVILRERAMDNVFTPSSYRTPTNYHTLPNRRIHSADLDNVYHKYNTLPKPSKKMKTLNWTKVPNQIIGKSIWASVTMPLVSIDYSQIDELFCQKPRPKSLPAQSSVDSLSSTLTSLLENKRSLAVNIFLKQFKGGAAQVLDNLRTCDGLPAERLKGLLRILPDDNEASLIKSHPGDPSTLETAERFYAELLEIPDYTLRVQAMLLKEECPVAVAELTPQLETVVTMCESLIHNNKLAEFLALLLQLGNYLNAGSYAGNAAGFKLNTLPKLLDTRANKPRMTFLHFAVDVAQTHRSNMLSFTEELNTLRSTARNPLTSLEEELRTLATGVRKLDKQVNASKSKDIQAKFKEFFKKALKDMEKLDKLMAKAKDAEKKLAIHFCEDPKKFQLEECFLLLADFFSKINQAVVDNEQRKKQEERAARLEAGKTSPTSPVGKKKVNSKQKIFHEEDESDLVDILMNEIKIGNFKLRRSIPTGNL